jgi:hypothetical protein
VYFVQSGVYTDRHTVTKKLSGVFGSRFSCAASVVDNLELLLLLLEHLMHYRLSC